MSWQRLTDLPDDRRSNKPWLPIDDRDVMTGLVSADAGGKPCCIRHGSMNRVHPFERVYRCSEFRCGVGAQLLES
jgi:hypothetical protein